MIGLLQSALRFALLCSPQMIFSCCAIHLFARTFNLPANLPTLHLLTIAALQAWFFLTWRSLFSAFSGAEARPWGRHLFSLALFLKSCAVNLLYFGSYASNQFWGAYLSAANLTALLPHLRGFRLAFGPGILVAAGLGILLLGVQFWLLDRLSPRIIRYLQQVGSSSPRWAADFLMALLASGAAAACWYFELSPDRLLRADPVLSFWTNRASARPLLTGSSLNDLSAQRHYRTPSAYRRRNVIVITIDCLRADHLPFRGYARDTMPFLTDLATAGKLHQVDFAISNGNDSPQGILSVLASRHPERHSIHNFKLPDLLQSLGYRTHLIATGDHTTLGDMRRFYGPGFDIFSDGLSRHTYSVNDDRGLHDALQAVEPASSQPVFFFFHLMSPHSLSVREERFARWQPALLQLDWGRMVMGGIRPNLMVNTYDNGLLQADHHLRFILETLETKGYMRDYVAVITGDHGEALGEHSHFGHTRHLYQEDINIPMLFMDSDDVDFDPMPLASQVDIAPTLLARLGLPAPPTWEGRDLCHAPESEGLFATGKRSGEWRATIQRDGNNLVKYLFYGKGQSDFCELLFNLTVDPMETTNLTTAAPGLLQRMRAAARQHFGRLPIDTR